MSHKSLARFLNHETKWPLVLLLGIAWAIMLRDSFLSVQVEQTGVNKDIVLRYFDRTLRMLEAADRADPYSQWIAGTDDKQETLESIAETISKNSEYAQALHEERPELSRFLSYKLGRSPIEAEDFKDEAYFREYRDWLLAGHGHAWQYEMFISSTGNSEVTEFYTAQNDRLLRRSVVMCILYDVLTVAGVACLILLFIRRPPPRPLDSITTRWQASSILGGFLAINIILTQLIGGLGFLYSISTYVFPEMLSYTAYDFIWRSFDTLLLVFLFLKTPGNALRVFRLKSGIDIRLLLAAFALISIMQYALYFLSQNGETDPTDFIDHADPDLPWMFFSLFSTVIVAPFFEEIVFRGFLLQGFRKQLGTTPAVIISTLLFAVVHIQYDIWGCLSVALMGFAAAILTLRTGSLVTAIAFHALINLWVTANSYYQYQAPL